MCSAMCLTLAGLVAAMPPQQPTPEPSVVEPVLAEVGKWLQLPPERRAKQIPSRTIPKDAVASVTQMVFATLQAEARAERREQLVYAADVQQDTSKADAVRQLSVQAAGQTMKVLERTFGKPPEGGHSLWISMHGGGGTRASVNDQQWRNQIRLYQPKEGIYVAPRAPTNNWNLWHEGHIDDLFDQLIENYVISRGVNPERVYLMGYSAGGDGVYQLAPRMADRFAAASMMAGHANGVGVLGLRNLPFMIWMGEKDGAYRRNEVAAEWGRKLDELAAGDVGGYEHETHIVAGKGHWMDLEDAASVPWMASRTRVTWPAKVVWQQSGRTHDRFYWLAVPKGVAAKGQIVRAEVQGQRIVIKTDGVKQLRLRLSDVLLDLDRELVVEHNGSEVFRGTVTRSLSAIYESLTERLDRSSVASAYVLLGA